MSRARRPCAAYCDGGLILANPSPWGGAWAYRQVDQFGLLYAQESGLVVMEDYPELHGRLTNNQIEYRALVACLVALPAGWNGPVYSDSRNALRAVFRPDDPSWVPRPWMGMARRAKARLGQLTPLHVGGHPTRNDLRRGYSMKGHLVSEHQHWCDRECVRIIHLYRAAHHLSSRTPRPAPATSSMVAR